MYGRAHVACCMFMLFAALGLGADSASGWPQFRGPNGSGVAELEQPPIELGPDRNVKWKVPAPSGFSSPIVAGDMLVITAFDAGKLFTIAYNRATGKELWRRETAVRQIERYRQMGGSPAASTPASDGARIVSYFGSYGAVCYDLTGKELWKFDMTTSPVLGNLGTGSSPIIADGKVIIVRDETKNPRVLALDAVTGKLRWEIKRQSQASWSTPVIWDTPSGRQIVAAGHGRLIGYDLATGAEKWFVPGMPAGCCTSPVTADGVLLFAGWSPGGAGDAETQIPSYDEKLKQLDRDKNKQLSRSEAGFDGMFDSQDANGDGIVTRQEYDLVRAYMADGKNGAFALKAGGSGDVAQSHVLWTQDKGLPYVSSALAYRGQYVLVKDGGVVTVYDAKSGAEVFRERAVEPGSYLASPVAANGHIYCVSLEEGVVTVLKADGNKLVAVAKSPPLGERVAATPALADDTLYLRSEYSLWAFSDRK